MSPARDRRLTLVRHAKAERGEAAVADADRPLSARGRRDAAEMAARLVAAGLVPTLILSSPALRAMETASAFAAAFRYPAKRIRVAEAAYLATARELLGVVRGSGGHSRHVMLFGHNPGISALAVLLGGDPAPGDMPTCGVASLLAPVTGWEQLSPAGAVLDRYDFPGSRRD